ncbi:S41 family peptidase [Aquimarina addita]|uniref:S41 family peptidase n=2 Tax=Aquimarina addita TaxID=870485 RepID=A0ABP7X9B6_9FLAO
MLLVVNLLVAQSIDDSFSQNKMQKDLEIFKKIRLATNSGLYKYRTPREIDSIYKWADHKIKESSTYRDFYNIINQLTDFEGSLHNNTNLPKKINQSLINEESGYFPYPIKFIEGKWIMNYDKGKIPLGAEIISINTTKIEEIIKNTYKYYTTDGINTTGKRIGLLYSFSKYYRLHYGLTDTFTVVYKEYNSDEPKTTLLKSVGNKKYYTHVENRYSKEFDNGIYKDWDKHEKYDFRLINPDSGLLTINTFNIGWHANHVEHKQYVQFLDSIFSIVKRDKITNLIIDVRKNGGGTDPNDLVTYSYLTDRNFSENKEAWISFRKIPFLQYNSDSNVPYLIKLMGVGKFNKEFQKEFPKEMNGKFYQDATSSDHMIRTPKPNAFHGNIYLLTDPNIASAASLFAAMVASNKNTTIIGEETMGGYFGHNGHVPLHYTLPKSKIETGFSVVNLEQDVSKKKNQLHKRGIIPDYTVTQSYKDFLNHNDTQMNFAIDLINQNTQ